MRQGESVTELEAEMRRYLMALYDIRALLTGHVVKAEHIRKVIDVIDEAVMGDGDDRA